VLQSWQRERFERPQKPSHRKMKSPPLEAAVRMKICWLVTKNKALQSNVISAVIAEAMKR